MSLSTFKNWRIAFLAFTLSFLVVFAPSVQANEVCSDLFGSRVVGAAGNDGDEGGLSFSTSLDLYFHGSVFGNGTGQQVAVNVVRAPRGAVDLNFVSTFSSEYEVGALKDVMMDMIWTTAATQKARSNWAALSHVLLRSFVY